MKRRTGGRSSSFDLAPNAGQIRLKMSGRRQREVRFRLMVRRRGFHPAASTQHREREREREPVSSVGKVWTWLAGVFCGVTVAAGCDCSRGRNGDATGLREREMRVSVLDYKMIWPRLVTVL